MVKGLLSVVIPSRNEIFLTKTIQDILKNSVEDIEIIVNIDENWPDILVQDRRVTYIHPSTPKGMRWGINSCVAVAKGEFIMKLDAHCLVAKGFDKVLKNSHKSNHWVQIPRRYSLDAENWKINEARPYRDYMYLCYPQKGKQHDDGMHGVEWNERQKQRTDPKYDFDETPSLQGSCYFMAKDHFDNFLHGLSEEGYGEFAQESQEIGNKTWLGGGAMYVNKKTYYAHLHKGHTYGRMYHFDDKENVRAINWSADYWMNNQWKERKHDIEWLIDRRFPYMPTWPNNWKEIWYAK
jgi:glycosyltransferase involved in cell wall biosynthesis